MASGPITSCQIDGETMETVTDCILRGLQNHCRWWLQPWNEKTLAPWKKSYDQPREHIKKQIHYFVNKGPSSQSYDFSSSHLWMWKLDYKESWVPKNWCFWMVVLEKTLESPSDCRRSNQSILKEISPGCSLEGLMLKLKLQYFGHFSFIWKDADAEKIEGRRRRGWQRMTWPDGITNSVDMSLSKLGVGDGEGNLVCCSPWCCKWSDTTERLNWTELRCFSGTLLLFW